MSQTKKLYVGSLPYSVNNEELRKLFADFNVESAEVIIDRYKDRSKGFGFVTCATPEDAQRAVEKMNGAPCGGRTLIVSAAKPESSDRSGGGGRGGRDRGFGGGDNKRRRDEW